MTHPTVPVLRWGRSWSQSVDQSQDFPEQFLWHRNLEIQGDSYRLKDKRKVGIIAKSSIKTEHQVR